MIIKIRQKNKKEVLKFYKIIILKIFLPNKEYKQNKIIFKDLQIYLLASDWLFHI